MTMNKVLIMLGYFLWLLLCGSLATSVVGVSAAMLVQYLVIVPITFPTYLRMIGASEERIRVLFGKWL